MIKRFNFDGNGLKLEAVFLTTLCIFFSVFFPKFWISWTVWEAFFCNCSVVSITFLEITVWTSKIFSKVWSIFFEVVSWSLLEVSLIFSDRFWEVWETVVFNSSTVSIIDWEAVVWTSEIFWTVWSRFFEVISWIWLEVSVIFSDRFWEVWETVFFISSTLW